MIKNVEQYFQCVLLHVELGVLAVFKAWTYALLIRHQFLVLNYILTASTESLVTSSYYAEDIQI